VPPEKYRLLNTFPKKNPDKNLKEYVLPVVVVRDPFRWMSSMVRLESGYYYFVAFRPER